VKVSCSRESAQVEHARTCILLNDVCVLVSLVFSERELIYGSLTSLSSSMHRQPQRLSSVTFVHPTQPIEIFGNVFAPFNTLVT